MAAHKKHDWPTIAADYIEGWQNGGGARHLPTMDELAEKWGIGPRNLRAKAGAESWVEKRSEFQAKLTQERQRYQLKELGRAQSRFSAKIATVAATLLDKIERKVIRVNDKTPPKVVKQISDSLRVAQVIGMTALGIDPDYPQKSLEEVMDEPEGSPMKRLGRTLYVEIVPKPPPEAHGDEKDE